MAMRRSRAHRMLAAIVSCSFSVLGCGGQRAARGPDVVDRGDEATGIGLARSDLEILLQEDLESLQSSALVRRWEGESRPAVAVLSMRDDTSEHLDSALQALIPEIESALTDTGLVRVVYRDSQPEMIEEVERQQSDAFDASTVGRLGRQVGAKYFVTGRVYTDDEQRDGERIVRYTLSMRVMDSETGDILWQDDAAVNRAIAR